jgi:hypothetical protein
MFWLFSKRFGSEHTGCGWAAQSLPSDSLHPLIFIELRTPQAAILRVDVGANANSTNSASNRACSAGFSEGRSLRHTPRKPSSNGRFTASSPSTSWTSSRAAFRAPSRVVANISASYRAPIAAWVFLSMIVLISLDARTRILAHSKKAPSIRNVKGACFALALPSGG